jgi:O-antigen/teichoic acid export membrane protein
VAGPAGIPGRAKRVLLNTFSLSGAEALSRLLTWVAILVLARSWDLERYGQYALAVNWVALFAGLTGLGLNPLAIREVAYDRKRTRPYLRTITLLRTGLSLIFVLAAVVLGPLMGYEVLVRGALVVLSLRLLFDAPASAYGALLQAHERMGLQGAVTVASAFLRTVGILLAILVGGGILPVAWVWVGVGAFSWAAFWVMGNRLGWRMEWSKFRWEEPRRILTAALPFAAFGAFQMAYYRADGILLKSLAGNEALALYDVAVKVLFVVFLAADLFSVSTLPALSAARDRRQEMGRLALRSLKALILIGAPLGVGGFLLGDGLMTAFFGEKYAASGPVFSVLSLAILLHYAVKPPINLLAVKEPSKLTGLYLGLLTASILGNLWAIPRWGAMGSAWVLVGCETLSLLAAYGLSRRYFQRPGRGFLRGAGVVLLCAFLMGLAVHWTPGLWGLVLGPAVYGVLLVLLKGLDREDRNTLRSVFARRGNPEG